RGVDITLVLIGHQDHHNVGGLGGLGDSGDLQALLGGLGPGGGALFEPDDDVDAGVAQAQRVGMALGAVADDGHSLAGEHGQVGVVVVIEVSHRGFSSVVAVVDLI